MNFDSKLCLFESSVVAADAVVTYHYPCSLALLPDGRLMATYSAGWVEPGIGHRLNGMTSYSEDFGRTWSEPYPLFSDETPPLQDFCDPNLAVIGDKIITFCQSVPHYASEKERLAKSKDWSRESLDSGKTWSPIKEFVHEHNYFAGMNHKVIRLSDGSYVRGFSWELNADNSIDTFGEGDQFYLSCLMRTTDGGQTWIKGQDVTVVDVRSDDPIPHAIHGAGEPAYVELPDGSLYMLVRTGGTNLYETRSTDMGQTWESVVPSPLISHNCPADLLKLDTGEIIVIYNDHPKYRSRLCVRLSADGCRTWSPPKHFAPVGFTEEEAACYPVAELLPDGSITIVWGQVKGSSGIDRYKICSARFTRNWILM